MFTENFLRRHSTRIISILPFMATLGMTAPDVQAQIEMRQGLKPFAEISSFDQNGVDIASGFSQLLPTHRCWYWWFAAYNFAAYNIVKAWAVRDFLQQFCPNR